MTIVPLRQPANDDALSEAEIIATSAWDAFSAHVRSISTMMVTPGVTWRQLGEAYLEADRLLGEVRTAMSKIG